ncbi:MAG: hypothetical protein SGJ20_22310, partial [Planctomycetota bacterium]|nr:hypothetical protein [Planctomycetota bacterium]
GVEVLTRSFSGSTFKLKAEMTAQLDADRKPVGLKEIDYAEASADDDRVVHGLVTQSSENIRYVGFENVDGKLTQYYSFSELIDANSADADLYAVTKLAYGDGAAIVKISNSDDEDGTYTEGWSGTSLNEDGSSSRLAKVQDKTSDLMDDEDEDELDLELEAAQKFDCDTTADISMELEMADFAECLEAYEIDQEGSEMCTDIAYD